MVAADAASTVVGGAVSGLTCGAEVQADALSKVNEARRVFMGFILLREVIIADRSCQGAMVVPWMHDP